MTTEVNGKTTTESEEREATPNTISAAELHTALDLLERTRVDVSRHVEQNLREHFAAEVHQKVLARIRDCGDVQQAVDGEISRRARGLFGMLGAAVVVLGAVGFTSLTPLVRSSAEAAAEESVRDEFDRQRRSIDDLRTLLASAQADLFDQRNEVLDGFRSTIAAELRTSETELKRFKESIQQELDERASRAQKRLDDTGATLTSSLKTDAADARSELARLVSSAEKNLQATVTDGLRQIARREKTAGMAGAGTLLPDAPETADLTNLAEGLAILTARELDDPLAQAEPYAKAGEYDMAIALLQPILLNPLRYSAEVRLSAARMVLDPDRSSVDRAQMVTEVLVSGIKAGDGAVIELAENEFASNALARFTKSEFDEFALAARGDASDERRERAFDAVDLDSLTGTGLVNLLALAKLAGLDDDRIQAAERRVINNVRTSNTIDRETDYLLAWSLVDTLQQEPSFDPDGISAVHERIGLFVFPEGTDLADPWELRTRLEPAAE